jgi:hypothetical protein
MTIDRRAVKQTPKHSQLDVGARHQLRIARDTLKMSEFGARIMGGMNHAEAREIINRLTKKK